MADPRGLALMPLTKGRLTFPFFNFENVDVVGRRHIAGNHNNLPFSSRTGSGPRADIQVPGPARRISRKLEKRGGASTGARP